MIERLAVVITLLGALFIATPAQANCEGIIINPPGDVVLNYDPFDELRETLDVELSIRGRLRESCQLAFAVQSLVPGVYRQMRGPQQGLRYELRVGGALLQNDLSSVAPSITLMPGDLQRGATIKLRFELPPGMLLPAGEYLDTLTVRAFDTGSGTPVMLRGDQSFTARLIVPASVRILLDGNFSRAGGPFGANVLDLGELSDGSERSALLQVRATSDVLLSISSRNNGQLMNQFDRRAVSSITYRASLDGELLDLKQGPAKVSRRIPGNAGRQNVRLTVSVPPVRDKPAGIYRDVLTITAEPN